MEMAVRPVCLGIVKYEDWVDGFYCETLVIISPPALSLQCFPPRTFAFPDVLTQFVPAVALEESWKDSGK